MNGERVFYLIVLSVYLTGFVVAAFLADGCAGKEPNHCGIAFTVLVLLGFPAILGYGVGRKNND